MRGAAPTINGCNRWFHTIDAQYHNVILLFSTALLTSARTFGEIVDTRIIDYVNVVYNIYGEMIWTRGSPGLKVPSAG